MPERLASLETDMATVKTDVAEIKRDVKSLLISDAGRSGIGAFISRTAPWWAIGIAVLALVSDVLDITAIIH